MDAVITLGWVRNFRIQIQVCFNTLILTHTQCTNSHSIRNEDEPQYFLFHSVSCPTLRIYRNFTINFYLVEK